MTNRLLVFVLFTTGLSAAVYVLLCVLLYAMQDDLIFVRVKNDPLLAKQWQARRVEIPGGDGIIEGWWAENANATGNLTLVYFGGNAEDVLYSAENASHFRARRMLVTNYRGYGATPGRPSEAALGKDALTIYDYVVKQAGISADNVVVVGRSLGSGVAVHVAASRPVRGAVLITPYDSMAAVAQTQYPYFPVRYLLKHKFASDEAAEKITAPALFLASARDRIVPSNHAQRLYEKWAGPKQIHVLANVGHNDIERHDAYYSLVAGFLEQVVIR